MKKFWATFLVLIFTSGMAFSGSITNLVLKPNSLYLLLLDSPAQAFRITNPNVVVIQVVDSIENDREQVLLQTQSEGLTQLDIEAASFKYQYKIRVDNSAKNAELPDNVYELESILEGVK